MTHRALTGAPDPPPEAPEPEDDPAAPPPPAFVAAPAGADGDVLTWPGFALLAAGDDGMVTVKGGMLTDPPVAEVGAVG